jgi:hypothetical protein
LPNINSYQPSSGQKIKDNGQVVNTAEMIESMFKALVVNKDAGFQLNGRKVTYQRVAVNQALAASGLFIVVLNVGLGTKSIDLAWKATGNVSVGILACDKDGNTLTSGVKTYNNTTALASSSVAQGGYTVDCLAGAPYVGIIIYEKSSAANTINFMDVYWS